MGFEFMRHLSAEEFIDIAEGLRPAPPHLDECAACRGEFESVRALMSAVGEVEVPEPSPLFWEHFSARVRDAVDLEPRPPARWFLLGAASWRFAVPAVVVAAGVVALLVVSPPRRSEAPPAPAAAVQPAPSGPTSAMDGRVPLADSSDRSFLFVSELTADMDMDTALEAGLVSDGSGDHAITHLNDDELRALAALLRAQLANERVS